MKKRKREAEEYRKWAAQPETKRARKPEARVLTAPQLVPLAKATSKPEEVIALVAENRAFVYPEAGMRLKLEPEAELLLGINCCAVCAKEELRQQCAACKRIWYCGNDHAVRDHILHKEVCAALALIADDEVKRRTLDETTATALVQLFCNAMAGSWVQFLAMKAAEESDSDSEEDEERSIQPLRDASGSWRGVFTAVVASNVPELCQMVLGVTDVPANAEETLCEALDPFTSSIGRYLTRRLSYPLTAANALRMQPHCFGRSRRTDGRLLLHVAGAAAAECELPAAAWAPLALEARRKYAVAEVVVAFFGDEVLAADKDVQLPVDVPVDADLDADMGDAQQQVQLRLLYCSGAYDKLSIAEVHARAGFGVADSPLAIIGFHMGLTVPDYDWAPSLDVVDAMKPTPLLVATTFSAHEAAQERNLLVNDRFFNCAWEPTQNLDFASSDCQQSDTMANDVIRANKYICLYRPTAVHMPGKADK